MEPEEVCAPARFETGWKPVLPCDSSAFLKQSPAAIVPRSLPTESVKIFRRVLLADRSSAVRGEHGFIPARHHCGFGSTGTESIEIGSGRPIGGAFDLANTAEE